VSVRLLIKGVISELDTPQQKAVDDAAQALRDIVASTEEAFPGCGLLALGLVGAESQESQ